LNRYSRQTILPWFGVDGQRRLAEKSVLIIGCGGTGCSCSSFLARSGLGKVLVVDPDVVSLTDLHRQILYDEADVEHLTAKADAAGGALGRSNSEIDIESIRAEFCAENAASLVGRADLVVDCSDNFETRMLINAMCLEHSIDWVHGACTGAAGLVIPFPAGGEVCYRCVVDHIPTRAPLMASGPGVFGPVAGMVGCLEAGTAIRMLIAPESVRPAIVFFDLLSNTYETIGIRRKGNCPACVRKIHGSSDGDVRQESFDTESKTARVILPGAPDLPTLRDRLASTHRVEDAGESLRVLTPESEVLLMPEGAAVVRPAPDLERARALVRTLLKG
jgi:molybdopterin/thiamine biosynthesis adenylyltransferase